MASGILPQQQGQGQGASANGTAGNSHGGGDGGEGEGDGEVAGDEEAARRLEFFNAVERKVCALYTVEVISVPASSMYM